MTGMHYAPNHMMNWYRPQFQKHQRWLNGYGFWFTVVGLAAACKCATNPGFEIAYLLPWVVFARFLVDQKNPFPRRVRALRLRAAYDPSAKAELELVEKVFLNGSAAVWQTLPWMVGIIGLVLPFTIEGSKLLGWLSAYAWPVVLFHFR